MGLSKEPLKKTRAEKVRIVIEECSYEESTYAWGQEPGQSSIGIARVRNDGTSGYFEWSDTPENRGVVESDPTLHFARVAEVQSPNLDGPEQPPVSREGLQVPDVLTFINPNGSSVTVNPGDTLVFRFDANDVIYLEKVQ